MKEDILRQGYDNLPTIDEKANEPSVRFRRSKIVLINLILCLVALLLPCVGAEWLLRRSSPISDTPNLFARSDTEYEWLGFPNMSGTYAGARVKFNDRGLRDPDRASIPPTGKTRIAVLGDSVAFGQGVAEADAFPRVTEALLNAMEPNGRNKVEILNMGIPGYNTLHELGLLRDLGLTLHPDIVVLAFMYNDTELTERQQAKRHRVATTASTLESGTETAGILSGLKQDFNLELRTLKKRSLFIAWASPRVGVLLRRLGLKGFGQQNEDNDRFVAENADWQIVQDALRDMKRECDARQIKFVLTVIPGMAKFNDRDYPLKGYHAALKSFCRSNDIDCLDPLDNFWGRDGTAMWVTPTDGHPNAEGHKIIAGALAHRLMALLP